MNCLISMGSKGECGGGVRVTVDAKTLQVLKSCVYRGSACVQPVITLPHTSYNLLQSSYNI